MKTWHYILIMLYIAIMLLVATLTPKRMNWDQSFSSNDSNPFGCEIVFNEMDELFSSHSVRKSYQSIYEDMNDTLENFDNYVIITKDLKLEELEAHELLNFANRGGNVFIASESIPWILEDSMKVGTDIHYTRRTFDPVNFELKEDSSSQYFSKLDFLNSNERYPMKQTSVLTYFPREADSISYTELGTRDSLADLLVMKCGEGNIILSCNPLAFTNYHILEPDTRSYLSKVFSIMPEANLVWNEYYKPIEYSASGRLEPGESRSVMRVIFSKEGLKWSWYILLTSLFLFILFYAKREQKAIPIVTPHKNHTLDYTRTVGSMYYEEGSPRDILKQRMNYFLDFVARRFYLRDISFTAEDVLAFSTKTGYPKKNTEDLFRILRNLKDRSHISDSNLLTATSRLNEFYRYI